MAALFPKFKEFWSYNCPIGPRRRRMGETIGNSAMHSGGVLPPGRVQRSAKDSLEIGVRR